MGGTATFAAVQAERLGLRAGVVTRAGADIAFGDALPNAMISNTPSEQTTSFQNVYEQGKRRQSVLGKAEPLSEADIPAEWRSAPMVLIGPVC